MTSGAGDGVSRRRWASLMTMLLSFTCLFTFSLFGLLVTGLFRGLLKEKDPDERCYGDESVDSSLHFSRRSLLFRWPHPQRRVERALSPPLYYGLRFQLPPIHSLAAVRTSHAVDSSMPIKRHWSLVLNR
ncbi:hypothetical protein Bca52824_025960 [Brassica carinata]|uniref:Uncharacterized protein n=1 Tax=Brassica carinata TaxID=52824 RepID=A0A8X7V8P0_BRACI|nr:hypothetical protein Bca52824_025960 [Brassica carinata]